MRISGHEAPQRLGARANDSKALPQVVQDRSGGFGLQFGRLGSIQKPALQTLRDGLNGRERIVQFMPKNANEPLPRFALFIAERPAQITQDDEMMWQAALPERPATQPPAPGTTRKGQLHGVRGLAFQTGAQSQFLRGEAQQTPFRTAQQTFTGAIDQAQLAVVIEGEDGQVNLLHHGAQEGVGFQRAQALLPEDFTEGIDFNHHFTHGIVGSRPASAQRKVFLAQGGQKIRKCLQGKNNAMTQ